MGKSKFGIFSGFSQRLYEAVEKKRMLLAKLLSMPMVFIVSQPAWALKASDLTKGVKSEWADFVQLGLFIVAGIGILTAAVGAISWVIAKRNNEPAKWQGWAMLGGAVAIVVPVFILAISGSLTNEQGNADAIMNEMGVNF